MGKKNPTAADRPAFRRAVASMMEQLNIQPAEISQDMVIICTRAADFNPADNVLWEHEINKSSVRDDVHCVGCKSAVAMSNDAYAKYQALDKKPKVCCIQCMVKVAAEEK